MILIIFFHLSFKAIKVESASDEQMVELQKIFEDNELKGLFQQFTLAELKVEHILFYEKMLFFQNNIIFSQNYQKSLDFAQEMYEDFILASGICALQFKSSTLRKQIKERIDAKELNATFDLFEKVQKEIEIELLQTFTRFSEQLEQNDIKNRIT